MIDNMQQAQDLADALLATCGLRPPSAKHQKILDDLEVSRARHEAWKSDQLAFHGVVMCDAAGLRARVLTMHGPVVIYGSLICEGCGNEPGPIAESKRFPCDTYLLARDWREDTP